MAEKKLLIASRWFYPVNNPRSFRTSELIKEFQARNYAIDGFLPRTASIDAYDGMNKVSIGELGYDELIDGELCCKRRFLWQCGIRKLKRLLNYLLGDSPRNVYYGWNLTKSLWKNARMKDYDIILSISYSFYVNVAIAIYSVFHKGKGVLIADCGDPFYYNPSRKTPLYLKWLERIVLRKFDYITIPVPTAVEAYRYCDINDRIRVIPQGFRLIDINKMAYKGNDVATFCYAGVFYEKIRNPKFFLSYLCELDYDFKFVVYALPDLFTQNLLQKYKAQLKEKLEIREPIPREELIEYMATMDFVINFDNDNTTQRPSKLIDYAMSRRPILSFNQASFQSDIFLEFLHGDYTHQERIDLAQYDIRHVVDQFEALCDEKIKERRDRK